MFTCGGLSVCPLRLSIRVEMPALLHVTEAPVVIEEPVGTDPDA